MRTRGQWGDDLVNLVIISLAGYVALVVFLNVMRGGPPPQDTHAIVMLKSIEAAQARYAAGCGRGAFADSLSTLATADAEHRTPGLATLAQPPEGYVFVVQTGRNAVPGPPDCKGRATTTAWYSSAVPRPLGRTGTRSFATNGSGLIWQLPGAIPPAEPFGRPAIPVQ